MQAWNDVFGNIKKSNPYQSSYLKIFLNKCNEAGEKEALYYELCLAQNMDKLSCEDPEIQRSIIDFATSSFFATDDHQHGIADFRHNIISKLTTELAKNNVRYYSFPNLFDKKISEGRLDENTIKIAVETFSNDVLSSLRNNYNNDEINNIIVFPTKSWGILGLAENYSNQKAVGLLNAYLEMLPAYMGYNEDRINVARTNFLDRICFGLDDIRLSKKIIRTLRLFFEDSIYIIYDDDDEKNDLYIKIRTFIDRDYHWGLEDPCLSFSLPEGYDDIKSKKQQNKLLEKITKEKIRERNVRTLKILENSSFWQNIRAFDFNNFKKAVKRYNVYDKKYSYTSDYSNVEYNLSILEEVIDAVIEYKNQIN